MKIGVARTIKLTVFFLVSLLIPSCTLSKAVYLGPDHYSPRAAPQITDEEYRAENINGIFPDAVYIKTRTQTFNLYHYYILHEGLIWYKSVDPARKPKDWTLFTTTGLPQDAWTWGFSKTKAIMEISADADELVALSAEGNFYRYCFDATIAHKSNAWIDRQGWPGTEQLYLDPHTAKNVSWALGKRNAHVLYYDDPFGNQHHNGTMEIATTYVLLADGQEIRYADPGLPSDFSRNLIGPERGAFRAAALSASASTMFVINEAGEMYTRLADFDTTGCDPMWFKYTYKPYKSDLSGSNYFSNLNEWGLPSEDWRPQPRIPLRGRAAVTRHITIVQNGQGNGARELRVAGLDEEGRTGYWSKAIFDDAWQFRETPLYFGTDALLKAAAPDSGTPEGERGPSLDKYYSGCQWTDGEKESGWKYELLNFNILEGDCDFRVSWRDESCTLKLYPVEMWTYAKRDFQPGRTGPSKMFFATLAIPENAFDALSERFVQRLVRKYAKNDKALFQYTITASSRFIFMRDIGNKDSVLYFTDGTISGELPDFQENWHVEHLEEIQRCYSPELIINNSDDLSIEALAEKTALNKALANEIKYKIRSLKWSQLAAFNVSAGYIPAHYLVKITPLRFIDLPKFHTITKFGKRIVLENSAYIDAVSGLSIRAYEGLVELLESRIRYFHILTKELSGKGP
jgi:hypothetical protein